jgi:hypothetical protein
MLYLGFKTQYVNVVYVNYKWPSRNDPSSKTKCRNVSSLQRCEALFTTLHYNKQAAVSCNMKFRFLTRGQQLNW